MACHRSHRWFSRVEHDGLVVWVFHDNFGLRRWRVLVAEEGIQYLWDGIDGNARAIIILSNMHLLPTTDEGN